MPARRRPRARPLAAAAFAVAVATVVAAGPASAHVTIPGEVEAGAIGSFSFTVPNERDDASTVSLEVKLPEDHPLPLVSVEAKAGWDVEVTMRPLDEPVELFGSEVTEVVDTVRWEGGPIAPGEHGSFTVRAGPFPVAVDELVMPAIQTYDSGEEVSWIEEADGSGTEPEHPAPVLAIAAPADAGGATIDGAPVALAASEDDGVDALTVVALALAVLATVLATLALVAGRRPR